MIAAVRSSRATCLSLAIVAAVACKAGPGARVEPDSEAGEAGSRDSRDSAAGGCRDNSQCAPGEYCRFSPGLCGKGKRAGVCRARPAACDDRFSPVCGCDGKAYDNECAASAAGVDLAVMGGCRARIPDWAACGARFCDVRRDYCEIFLSDVFELPTDHFCRPLPPACLPRDGSLPPCSCFPAGTRCANFCGPMETGGLPGFHLTCQGVRPPP